MEGTELDRLPEEFHAILTEEEKKFFEDKTREYYMDSLENMVLTTINYVRFLENKDQGEGKKLVEDLYETKDINKAMYDILTKALEDKEYVYTIKRTE